MYWHNRHKAVEVGFFVEVGFQKPSFIGFIQKKTRDLRSQNFRFFKEKTLKIQISDSQSQQKIVYFHAN